MVRQTGQETGEGPEGRRSDAADRLGTAFDQFRETRLFAQVVMSLALAALALVAVKVPLGPLQRAVAWVGTHDSDFVGSAARANTWARDRGGWVPASLGALEAGMVHLREWVDLPDPVAGGAGLTASGATGAVVGSGVSGSPAPAVRSAPAPAPPATTSALPKPVMPVDGALLFGFGWPPPGTGDQFHEGLDLVAAEGAPVVAVADGTVSAVRLDPKLGRLIEVDHGAFLAVYAQVGGVQVSSGQKVRRGQPIAALAKPSGLEQTQPPHLHFEVRTRTGHVAVDPAAYLGWGGTRL